MTPRSESEPKGQEMRNRASPPPKIRHGILGGLLGGMVFALLMLVNGTLVHEGMMTLPLIGRLVGGSSLAVGLLVHMLGSAVIGALFVMIFARAERGIVDGLHFGMLYGLIWWVLGPMTLMPWLLGMGIGSQWNLANIFRTFPSLIGHLLYGAILGMTVGWFPDASLPAHDLEDEATPTGRPATPPAADEESIAWDDSESAVAAAEHAPLAGPAPLWLTTGAIAVVFFLNVVVFGYALMHGMPHAAVSETVPVAASTAPAGAADSTAAAATAPAGATDSTKATPAAASGAASGKATQAAPDTEKKP